jgi:preprotein translocase subunit SecG
MDMAFKLIMVVQVLSALIIIGLVLLQHGKGADMGAAFGSGASGSLFGASGSSNFMSKSTGLAAAIFFGSTLALSYMGTKVTAPSSGSLMEGVTTAPATGPSVVVPTPAPAPAVVAPAAEAPVAPAVEAPAAAAPAEAAPAVPAEKTPK